MWPFTKRKEHKCKVIRITRQRFNHRGTDRIAFYEYHALIQDESGIMYTKTYENHCPLTEPYGDGTEFAKAFEEFVTDLRGWTRV